MQGLPIFLGVIEITANRCLRLDREACDATIKFAGQAIALDVRGFQRTVFLHFTSDGVHLTLSLDREPDARVRATPAVLLRSLSARDTSQPTLDSDIEVDGDIDLVLEVKGVIDRFDVDWEEELSHLFGDVAAHQLGNVYRRAERWREESWGTILQDTAEYLVEEGRFTPSRDEIVEFINAIDTLRDDTERLKQRIRRLLDARAVSQS